MRTLILVALSLLTVSVAAADEAPKPFVLPDYAATFTAYQPIHPPLDCMKPFKLKEYALVAFVYRHRGNHDYSEQMVLTVKGGGFNVLMDLPGVLDNAAKHDLKVLVAAIWYDTNKLKALGDGVFKHKATIGFNLWDNASGLPRQTLGCARWLKQTHPSLLAYLAENPNAGHQSRTSMKVLSTQNYAFGYNNRGPDNIKRFNFCNSLENDRRSSNKLNMTYWPIFASLARKTVGDTEIRFQTFAPVAYGAQGAVSFAYSLTRGQWKMKTGPVYKSSAWAGQYIQDVVGRHVIGCRSIGVYHTAGGGDRSHGALAPGPGKIIQAMDPALLAGVLVVENGFDNFKKGEHAPAYVMVVDKRTVYYSRPQPPERTVHVTFGDTADIVEVLHRRDDPRAPKLRHIEPAWTVAIEHLKGGDGRLIRINPPDLDTVLAGGADKLYREIVQAYGLQRAKIRTGEATLKEFEAVDAAASAKLEKLLGTLGPIEGKTSLSPQSADTIRRLKAAIASLRQEAYAPRTADGSRVLAGAARLELICPLKGAKIRYTLDAAAPVEQFKAYTAPLPLTASTTVRAVAVGSDGKVACKPVALKIVRIKGAGAAGVKVNFQPKNFATPAGCLADSGELYGVRGDQAYGWNIDRTATAATRGGGTDPLKRTQVSFLPRAVWEFALENGTYEVTVSVGDAHRDIWNASIFAEGVQWFHNVPLKRGQFKEHTQTVNVTDGRLTLKSHDRLRVERLTKINYVIIKKK